MWDNERTTMMKAGQALTGLGMMALVALGGCYPYPYPPQPDPNYGQGGMIAPPGPPAPQVPQYPVGRPTTNPNVVISPYAPYNAIDVAGYRSGDLVRDPSNREIFRVP